MKFNAEQVTEYLNMEAAYREMERMFKELTTERDLTDGEYAELCRRYAQATIQIIKLRSFVRGSNQATKGV
jgi:hypothetical protein